MPHARIPPNLTQGPRPPTALSAANLYCAVPPLPPSPPTTQPRWPYCNKRPPVAPPFYGPFQPLGLITGGITGLQHALAMAGGLVTPPILIGTLCPDPATRTCETSMTGLSGLCVGGGGGSTAADTRAECAAAELRQAISSQFHSLQTRPVAPPIHEAQWHRAAKQQLAPLTTYTTLTTYKQPAVLPCRPDPGRPAGVRHYDLHPSDRLALAHQPVPVGSRHPVSDGDLLCISAPVHHSHHTADGGSIMSCVMSCHGIRVRTACA